MKTETGITVSIKKWKGARRDIKKKKAVSFGYISKYWQTCGYCEVFKYCNICPLHKENKKYGTLYCCALAMGILDLADNKKWDDALERCNTLLAKMKRDLRGITK